MRAHDGCPCDKYNDVKIGCIEERKRALGAEYEKVNPQWVLIVLVINTMIKKLFAYKR